MKALKVAATALVTFVIFTGYSFVKTTPQYVYLCDSKASKVYHLNPNCRGLKNCKHGVFKTTKDSAINYYGRRACKVCGNE